MTHEVTIGHNEGMSFTGEVNGHEMTIDAHDEFGGKNLGPRPKQLVLLGLVGCTGMDVASLMNKMRVKYDDFKVTAKGELTEEHPKYYHKIEITYSLWGKDIDHAKVEKAVNLSMERYCGVSYMLEQAAELTHVIKYYED